MRLRSRLFVELAVDARVKSIERAFENRRGERISFLDFDYSSVLAVMTQITMNSPNDVFGMLEVEVFLLLPLLQGVAVVFTGIGGEVR